MGSYATPPVSNSDSSDDTDDDSHRLGDLLSGRFSDVNIDSVEAVRDDRERE